MNDEHDMDQRSLVRKLFEVCGGMQRQLVHHHHPHGERGGFESPHRGQGRVLALLKLKPKTTQKELSFLLDMRPQSLGELLSKLEKNELIVRKPSEKDRRVMEVELTEKGQQQAEKADKMSQESTGMLDCLNEEERKNLDVYLDKILAQMEKDGNGGKEGFFGRMRQEQPGQPREPRSPRPPRRGPHGHGMEEWPGGGFGMF